MTEKIGVYLGREDDPTKNITNVLEAIGRYLSDHELEAFGTASLPRSVQDYYTQFRTTARSPRTPYTEILATYRNCREYIRQRSPDVLFQLWKYQTHAPGVALAGHLAAVPTITRLTGDVYQEYQGYTGIKKAGVFALANIFGRIPTWISDSMIVFGPYGREQASTRGMDTEDIVTIPPPGDLDERFSPTEDKDALRQELNLPTDRDIVLYIGRLSRQKGMEFLAKVIKQVTNEREILFVLVGEGPYSDDFAERFSASIVRLPGYIPHEKIHQHYRAADVYVHPSFYEGIPLVLIEAMNCDVPVISYPAGDIEVLTPNVVETPSEMATTILSGDWSNTWLNKEYFTEQYQKNALNELVRSICET